MRNDEMQAKNLRKIDRILRKSCLILIITLAFVNVVFAKNNPYLSAKKSLLAIYQSNPESFYCRKSFNEKGELLLSEPELVTKKSLVITWEHIVPVRRFGKTRPCWNEPRCHTKTGKTFQGRRCCHQSDAIFQRMESDMHNLVPAVPSINQVRRDYEFAVLSETEQPLPIKACDIWLDKKQKLIQPPPHTRGMIARAYLYMHQRYGIDLNQQEMAQYQTWHRAYPPSEWEKQRNLKISQVQGNPNPWIHE